MKTLDQAAVSINYWSNPNTEDRAALKKLEGASDVRDFSIMPLGDAVSAILSASKSGNPEAEPIARQAVAQLSGASAFDHLTPLLDIFGHDATDFRKTVEGAPSAVTGVGAKKLSAFTRRANRADQLLAAARPDRIHEWKRSATIDQQQKTISLDITVTINKPFDDAIKRMDPQKWGRNISSFGDTFIVDHKNGKYEVDRNYVPAEKDRKDLPEPGTPWGEPQLLYEKYNLISESIYFQNVLWVNTELDSKKSVYTISFSLDDCVWSAYRASKGQFGLLRDYGTITVTRKGDEKIEIHSLKTLRYQHRPAVPKITQAWAENELLALTKPSFENSSSKLDFGLS